MTRGKKSERPAAPVPEKVCRAHLEKVTSSATFARAEQLRKLLTWVGGRSLETDVEPPTEKEIGATVLGRKDFDPQEDSLVRKEMSRLRAKLAQYYGKEGAGDRVRIRHVSGYVLHFAWSDHLGADPAPGSGTPCLLMLPLRSHPDLIVHAIPLADELCVRLGEASRVTLVSPTTALSYAGRVGDVRDFAAECGADLVLEGNLHLAGGELRATFWLVDGRTGRTGSPGRFPGEDPHELARLAALWLEEQIDRLRIA